jgi:hypothetical protein
MADANDKPTQEPAPQESRAQKIVAILRRHGVEFMMIGGQAEVLMGSPRVTFDTDICYRRTPEDLERVAAALKEMKATLRGAPPDLPIILDARALALGNNYTFNTLLGPLDLLGWVEPIGDFQSLLPGSEAVAMDGAALRLIGLDDLIRVKQRIGRPKDRDSLLQLLAIRRLREEGKSGGK